MKVCFLIRSLNIGGAERQLLVLLKNIDRQRIQPIVITFYSEGTFLSEFEKNEIPIRTLQKKGRWDVFPFITRLISIMREEKPDVVFSFLVAANLLAIISKPFIHQKGTVISIRHAFLPKEDNDWLASLLYWTEDRISRWCDLIIINSHAGAERAINRGIPASKILVINNGIDTNKFVPDGALRERKRKEIGFKEMDVVFGLVGRLDPVKDHTSFISAAGVIVKKYPRARFVIVGDGDKPYQNQLEQQIFESGLNDEIQILPAELDLLPLYNALDICVSSSVGEGFSNVIAEAMSCEVPCVVTDVGDSARIVGETGRIVCAGNLDALISALEEMVRIQPEERKNLGIMARMRIKNRFSVETMVEATTREIEKLG
ncbi:MAG: glycosyltransferase [Leptolinea sp.]|nr:glycosyltransferase [Leptolinea sp.]